MWPWLICFMFSVRAWLIGFEDELWVECWCRERLWILNGITWKKTDDMGDLTQCCLSSLLVQAEGHCAKGDVGAVACMETLSPVVEGETPLWECLTREPQVGWALGSAFTGKDWVSHWTCYPVKSSRSYSQHIIWVNISRTILNLHFFSLTFF